MEMLRRGATSPLSEATVLRLLGQEQQNQRYVYENDVAGTVRRLQREERQQVVSRSMRMSAIAQLTQGGSAA